jgi:hypothetical protein
MATVPSVSIVKTFFFKGGTRAYSNRYHFTGGTPADATHWHTLFDNIVDDEKAALSGTTTITEAIGYAAGSDVPVATKTYAITGTYSAGGTDTNCPGEVAALVRYSTAARTTKNHPIYCFNYYHHVFVHGGGVVQDELAAGQKTALETYAGQWLTGITDGTITAKRSTPNGATVTGHNVEEYVTHRDFPYTRSL